MAKRKGERSIPFLLTDARVHSNRREVTLPEELVQLGGTEGALDENDDLVKLQLVEKFVKLAVLLSFLERDIILLEAVQGQLGVFIDVMLGRVLHEFPADRFDVVRESS